MNGISILSAKDIDKMMQKHFEDTFQEMWLPYRPYCADKYYDGIYRKARTIALTNEHFETNPKALTSMIVLDIDASDGLKRCLDANSDFRPNVIIENPKNGHVHAAWYLKDPVCKTYKAHEAPIKMLNWVTEGLRRFFGGDPGYAKLIMKNPFNEEWNTTWTSDYKFSLGELANALRMQEFIDGKHYLPSASEALAKTAEVYGRNCTLFDNVRKWAYRAVRNYLDSYDRFKQAVYDKLVYMNNAFEHKLSDKELGGICKSIVKWVWRSKLRTKSDKEYAGTFSEMQRKRCYKGMSKSIATRQSPRNMFLSDIKNDQSLLKLSVKELALAYSVSERTIYRWLSYADKQASKHSSSTHTSTKTNTKANSVFHDSQTAKSSRTYSQKALSTKQLSDLVSCQKDDSCRDSRDKAYDGWLDSWMKDEMEDRKNGGICKDDGADSICMPEHDIDICEDINSCHPCPECGEPVWGSDVCLCMMTDDMHEDLLDED